MNIFGEEKSCHFYAPRIALLYHLTVTIKFLTERFTFCFFSKKIFTCLYVHWNSCVERKRNPPCFAKVQLKLIQGWDSQIKWISSKLFSTKFLSFLTVSTRKHCLGKHTLYAICSTEKTFNKRQMHFSLFQLWVTGQWNNFFF